jgi:hypothetical protein
MGKAGPSYPRLFTLGDPLEEPRPLCIFLSEPPSGPQDGQTGSKLSLATQDLEIEFVSSSAILSQVCVCVC